MKSIAILVVLCGFGLPAHSLDIYQWVDELGKPHMGDVVPEKYRATAKLLSYRRDNVSDEERKDAQAKAEKIKQLLAPKQSETTAPPTVVSASKPVEPVQRSTCNQKWDEFYQSQECFAPYLVPHYGGAHFKPEAYSKCQVVKMPAADCQYDKRLSPK